MHESNRLLVPATDPGVSGYHEKFLGVFGEMRGPESVPGPPKPTTVYIADCWVGRTTLINRLYSEAVPAFHSR
jgi:hypothetical protein